MRTVPLIATSAYRATKKRVRWLPNISVFPSAIPAQDISTNFPPRKARNSSGAPGRRGCHHGRKSGLDLDIPSFFLPGELAQLRRQEAEKGCQLREAIGNHGAHKRWDLTRRGRLAREVLSLVGGFQQLSGKFLGRHGHNLDILAQERPRFFWTTAGLAQSAFNHVHRKPYESRQRGKRLLDERDSAVEHTTAKSGCVGVARHD